MTTNTASKVDVPSHVPPECVVDFDTLHPPGAEKDFFGAWKKLHDRNGPDLVWTPWNGGHWIATRAEDIRAIFADGERFSSRLVGIPPESSAGMNFIPLQSDAPEHGMYRKIITKELALSHLRPLMGPIRDMAVSLIEGFRDKGHCEFVSEFAEILPVHVFLMLIGLPVSDRPMLRELVLQLNRPDPETFGDRLLQRVDDYLIPHVMQRMATPGDDLFSRILSKPVEGRPWTMDEAMRMCRNLLFGGLDTVVALLSFVALHLARHPGHQDALRADPSLIPDAAFEFTRRFGPVCVARVLATDVELHGITMRKDEMVLLPTMLHNIDPRWLADAWDVKLDRGPSEHCAMGNGPHRCVGEGLARIELMTFLEEWLARVPAFRVADEDAVEMCPGNTGAIGNLPLCW